jgi:hypothetical protein
MPFRKADFAMTSPLRVLALSATIALIAPTAFAQDDVLDGIYKCAAIADEGQRLSCYDQAVGRMRAAQTSGELITLDRSEMAEVQKDGFGFEMPSLSRLRGIFGGGEKEKDRPVDSAAKPATPRISGRDALTAPVQTELTAAAGIEAPRQAVPAVQDAERQALAEAAARAQQAPVEANVDNIIETLRAVREFGYKKQRFFLANGQVWEQTDTARARIPRNVSDGTVQVEIKRAALGSYLLQVDGQGPFIRVRRRR